MPRFAIPALRQIPTQRPAVRWRHWIVGVDDLGRVTLPADTRPVLRDAGCMRAVSRDKALLLHRKPEGADVHVDVRGRLVLPVWLRRLVEPSRSVLVAARWPEVSCVVVTLTSALDGLVDAAAGEVA